ncbi:MULTISPECIES: RIO1 family regulatory kinase/ATPase domain-containing protein [unclassified Lonepinella]|uniref:RIO1 family regulatory kinase/ATPase domain-containing protein n=1 Tax=unclassified Lonepinella TaxID=2642006 RepID=UPI0036DD93DC
MTLEQYAQSLCSQHPDKRVYPFEFENKCYWLKQPEKPKGSQRLLKIYPHKAFHREVERLLKLKQKNAPIPHIYIANDNMLVMEDAGLSVSHWLSDKNISPEQKQQILNDSAIALAKLHKQKLIHGRPFVKDILWKDGLVSFVDFEVDAVSNNPTQQQVQDNILFIIGLCREQAITKEQIRQTILTYKNYTEQHIWQATLNKLWYYRWAYWLLLPFKKIAGKDLKALYLLIEICYQDDILVK